MNAHFSQLSKIIVRAACLPGSRAGAVQEGAGAGFHRWKLKILEAILWAISSILYSSRSSKHVKLILPGIPSSLHPLATPIRSSLPPTEGVPHIPSSGSRPAGEELGRAQGGLTHRSRTLSPRPGNRQIVAGRFIKVAYYCNLATGFDFATAGHKRLSEGSGTRQMSLGSVRATI